MEIDINPTNKQTVSDDPELAKVLAGVNSGAAVSDDSADNQDDDLQYETLNSETNTINNNEVLNNVSSVNTNNENITQNDIQNVNDEYIKIFHKLKYRLV